MRAMIIGLLLIGALLIAKMVFDLDFSDNDGIVAVGLLAMVLGAVLAFAESMWRA